MTPVNVPVLDFVRQHKDLKQELLAVAEKVFDTGVFVGGPMVEQFENEFAHFTDSRFCIGVNSGTDALRFALAAMGAGAGTSVVTVPNSFVATAASITQAGSAIEFVDIDPGTCLMDPNALEDHLNARFARPGSRPRPVIVVPVHLYGQCCDMDAINSIARKFGMKVLEDAAQAHGATYYSRPAGSLGDAAAFSLFPGKNLGACGDAGAITTNDSDIRKHTILLRDHGRTDKHFHIVEGYNGRLDALQAGFLSVKLKRLPKWNEQRRQQAATYDAALASSSSLHRVRVEIWNQSCFHQYVVRTAERERFQAFLRERGIASGIHYPIPLHLQPCYSRLGLSAGSFPHAEDNCARVVSLPLFPEMDETQQQRVIDAVHAFDRLDSLRKAG